MRIDTESEMCYNLNSNRNNPAVFGGTMNISIYQKKLCMTELHIAKVAFSADHYFDAGMGQINSTFIYVIKGKVAINSISKKIEASSGELLFIPEGIRYTALWSGSPEIEYYSLRIISKKVDITDSAGVYALQKIEYPGAKRTAEVFNEIYRLFSTEERVKMIRALGHYYIFYADILPHLISEPPSKHNPALICAIKYIDTNYADDFSTAALAAYCHVSESRLYHLFCEELNTTPTKYRTEVRTERAASELRTTSLSIEEIARRNGFNSASYFRETFKAQTGLPPTEYRRMAKSSKE